MSLRGRYLKSFDVKLAELREALGRLGGADDVATASTELRRRLQTLAGSGDVYGVSEVSEWARETLRFLDAMRSRTGLAASGDAEELDQRVDALATTIGRLIEAEGPFTTSLPPELPVPLRDGFVPWAEGPEASVAAGDAEPPPVTTAPSAGGTPAAPSGDRPAAASGEAVAPAPSAEPAPTSVSEPAAAPSTEPSAAAPAEASVVSVSEAEAPSTAASDGPSPDRVSEPPTRLSDPEITILGSSVPTAFPPPLPPGASAVLLGALARRSPGDAQEIAVLVIDSDELTQRDIREALSAPQYRVSTATDPETGLEMARTEAPDLIFMGAKVGEASGFTLLERLRADALTQFVPVVIVTGTTELTERTRGLLAGAADFLAKPFDSTDVVERVQRIAVELGPEPEGVPDLGAASLPEIVRFIEREMRRGLLDSAELPTEDLRIHLGRGGEILAATWAAVARLREVVARMSNGRVRFRAVSHGRLGVLALHAEDKVAVSSEVAARGPSADLAGRVVLVADDDPAVRWLFASVLGDAGASVDTAPDGRSALERARARRPDVIVSDILMPGMDGWELCGAIRSDFALRDTPIVLLSWKEDFFQRMKELAAGADEYLLKEAQRSQILDRLRHLLRPRALLEARLSAGREVHGRVDATGILTLVRSVATVRGDARIAVRENWNLFELELRAGRPISCTRTATDGSFTRGPTAFSELLGVDGGRYSIGPPTEGLRPNLEGELEEAIHLGAHHINELVALVVGGAAMRIARIVLATDAIEAYLRAAPERVRAIVRVLAGGTTPREMVLEGSTSLLELERILIDLIKRGGVSAIEAPPPESHIALPPPTPDQRRWETLRSEDRSDEAEMPPPPPPARVARPSAVPAEAPSARAPLPAMPEGRPSLAPMTIPSVRPSSTQTRLAWTLVVVGALVGVALWAYNFANMSKRGQHSGSSAADTTGTDEAAPSDLDAPPPDEGDESEPVNRIQLPPTEIPAPPPEHEDTAQQAPDAGPAEARAPPPPPPRERTQPARTPDGGSGEDENEEPAPPERAGGPEPRGGQRERTPAGSGTLQVIAGSADAEGVEVLVDGERRGTVPLNVPVSGGLHEVRLQRSNGPSTLRYVYVPAGESRRLIVPRLE